MKKLTIALVEQALRTAVETSPKTGWTVRAGEVLDGILKGFRVCHYDKPNTGVGRPQIPMFAYLAPEGQVYGFSHYKQGSEYRTAARMIFGRFAGLNPEYYGPKLPTPEGYLI